MKRRLSFQENYIFLVLVFVIFLLGAYGLVKMPAKTSVAENRTLAQFQHFTLKSFLDGTFQNNFEEALSDQFIGSEKIRTAYGEVINNLPTFGLDRLVCTNHYITLPGNSFTNTLFNCDDYMIAPAMTIDPKQKSLLESDILANHIEKYNHVNDLADTYYYFIEEAQSFNFEDGTRVLDLEKELRSNLNGSYTMTSLQFDSYDEFKKYYYKTDHHWNYIGAYKGYQDIAKMFGIENPAKPISTVTNHEYFFGSRSRDSQTYDSKEEFTVYKFDLPKHDTYINRKLGQYGHFEDFEAHNYKYKKSTNYYGWVYGGDSGEVIFDFHQPEKDDILIISNSFDNAIIELLAQHFNKTYAIDLRNYKRDIGEDFVFSEYIKTNKINKVLFVMSPRFIYNEESNQGLEL